MNMHAEINRCVMVVHLINEDSRIYLIDVACKLIKFIDNMKSRA
jgi:hypothetical protein